MSKYAAAITFFASIAVAVYFLQPAPEAAEPTAKDSGPVRFTEILIQDKYGYAYGIAAADLDGDGNIDLTSSDTVNNNLYWFQNDGKGNLRRHFIQKGEPGWFERHAIGDVNGDGHRDVVVVKNKAGGVVWFQNSGTSADGKLWKRHVICQDGLPGAYDVALADFDGDGHLDVAASSWRRGNQFVWFRNSGKPTDGKEWKKYVIADKLNETRTVEAADFNGDKKMDLLGTATAANLTAWFENSGKPADGPWKKHVIDHKSPRPTHGHAVDMDGDGDMDVVMALGFLAPPGQKDTHQVVWYENVGKPGNGTRWKKHVIGELEQAFEAVAVDLNGDGHLDVVATAWGKVGCVVWFENPGNPKGKWKKHVLKEKWPLANQVIAVDLNKDGKPDLAAVAERGSNEFRWWRNEGPAKK